MLLKGAMTMPLHMRLRFALLSLLVCAGSAFAQSGPTGAPEPAVPERHNPQDANYSRPERGWFFFEGKKKEEPAPEKASPPPEVKPLPKDLPPPPKEDKCKKKESWSVDCGFVHPGTDFEFQAKQRDALLERMVVSENDPKAVEAFQYYMRWVLERVSEVANVWHYNMVQNPELDPQVQQPISAMGLRLMSDVQSGKAEEIAQLLREEGAFLVYFSRHDCNFCHDMAPVVKRLAEKMNIPVRNAALDATCIAAMAEGCVANAVEAAGLLQVSVVPTVFLHVPKNTWIRIATGISDERSMHERVMQFFLAYRSAMLKGVQNGQGGRASVDFSGNEKFMGGASAGTPTPKGAPLPTEVDIAKMLGAK